MRVLTLIQISAAALFPLGLLLPHGPNSEGANPTAKSAAPDADASTNRSTQAELPAPPVTESIASPERFPTAPLTQVTPIEEMPLVQVPALPPAGQTALPSTPKPAHKSAAISPPELSRMPWDRIIERSTGMQLGQMTAAVSSKALLAKASVTPNPKPVPAARNSQPSDPSDPSDPSIQAATPSPTVEAKAEATVPVATAPVATVPVATAPVATVPVTPPPPILVAANPIASPPSAPLSDVPGGLLQQPSVVAAETTAIAQGPTSPGIAPVPNSTPISPTVADASYTLGVGDQLQITFFNVPEYSGNYQVLVDGSLNMPMVGAVSVTGLTLRQAEAAIASRYSAELSNAQVTISLLQARPVQIGVVGEVGQPGFYIGWHNERQAALLRRSTYGG